jgi:hypothetical protein
MMPDSERAMPASAETLLLTWNYKMPFVDKHYYNTGKSGGDKGKRNWMGEVKLKTVSGCKGSAFV